MNASSGGRTVAAVVAPCLKKKLRHLGVAHRDGALDTEGVLP